MPKNIVFDLGRVLASFDPHEFLQDVFHNETLEMDLFQYLFVENGYWDLYDQGIMSAKDIVERSPSLIKAEVEIVMKEWVKYVIPFESSLEVLKDYKDAYNLYMLSNIPKDNYDYFFQTYDLDAYLVGGVYSYQEKLIKPDPEIFKILLNRYNLKANECLFIDDKLENIESAKTLGFHVIHLTNPMDLRNKIEEKLNEM